MKIAFKLLQRQGDVCLVEWRDLAGPHRSYVPASVLNGAEAEWEQLEQGAPYGVQWQLLPIGNVGPEQIALELRERGFWTPRDVQTGLVQVRTALQQAYSRDLRTILEAARNK